jgi:hypothetical protein
MFEGVTAKVMASLVSLSALMFSSYTGNEPAFKPLQSRQGNKYVQMTAQLDKAFENDFSEVFRSGKSIHILFRVEVSHNKAVVWQQNFRHTVNFDPMNAAWQVYSSEAKQNQQFTSYPAMIKEISELEFSVPLQNSWKQVEVKVESWMPKIVMETDNREIDLMMLWKFKRPIQRTRVNLQSTS